MWFRISPILPNFILKLKKEFTIVAVDCGFKMNILRLLEKEG